MKTAHMSRHFGRDQEITKSQHRELIAYVSESTLRKTKAEKGKECWVRVRVRGVDTRDQMGTKGGQNRRKTHWEKAQTKQTTNTTCGGPLVAQRSSVNAVLRVGAAVMIS